MTTEITVEKLFNIQVCSDVTDPDVLTEEVNRLSLCGTTKGWSLADDPDLAPVRCEKYPERTHYIFNA